MNSKDLIKRHEGLRLDPYRDTVGVLTIGYGYNLEEGISQDVADHLFDESYLKVRRDCRKFLWFEHLCPARQAVIENMIFNLGLTRFSKFANTIRFIEEGDFKEAGDEMLRSKWARQVGYRSEELAQMMRTGDWP